MKTKTTSQFGKLTDEQIENLKAMGFMEEIPEEPVEEKVQLVEDVPLVEEKIEEVKEMSSKFVFEFDFMDDEVDEKFVLNEMQEAMKQVFFKKDENGIKNSVKMSRVHLYIPTEDENGLPYGNFNGAGPRAITMYQPDHPEAGKGKNYGKVFYRWSNPKVVPLMEAIFERCGWNPEELLKEEE